MKIATHVLANHPNVLKINRQTIIYDSKGGRQEITTRSVASFFFVFFPSNKNRITNTQQQTLVTQLGSVYNMPKYKTNKKILLSHKIVIQQIN